MTTSLPFPAKAAQNNPRKDAGRRKPNTKTVIALLGSKRKANTYGLLKQLERLLAAGGARLEIVPLYQYTIQDCLGCDGCVLRGGCGLRDDVPALMDKLAAADGLILASPVYLQQVSGKLKTFLDRTCRWYHRPVLAGKPVLCVATTKGSGLAPTLAYLENIVRQWGAVPAGKIGRTIFQLKNPVTARETARFLRLLDHPEQYAPSVRVLVAFEVQKALARFLNGLDTAYWQQKGWFDRPYFYPCRILPHRRAVSGTAGAVMRRVLSRTAPQTTHATGAPPAKTS